MYSVRCAQCVYRESAATVIQAKYLRNKHMKEHHHFEVDYERIA